MPYEPLALGSSDSQDPDKYDRSPPAFGSQLSAEVSAGDG
jgi:hypothetical protein